MNKSDFLDELRLKVGLAYDYAENRDDFIVRVLKTIYTISKKKGSITIHCYHQGEYVLKYALGMRGLSKEQVQLGSGFLFANRFRSVSFVRRGENQVLFLPVYEKKSLVYVISMRLINSNYRFTKQDMIFAEELVHFIETKSSTF